MQFITSRPGDLATVLSSSAKEYDKLPGPEVTAQEITGLDQDGNPRIVVRAETVAIVHLAMDHAWQNPSMRWNMIEQAYTEIRTMLKGQGISAAYCFFPDGVPNGYVRRLVDQMGADRIIDRCVRFTA